MRALNIRYGRRGRLIFFSFILPIFILSIYLTAFARSGGYTGRTSSSSNGCGIGGSCHATSANSATTISVTSGSGSFVVDPSSQTTFSVTVANSTAAEAGVNISVNTSQTGNTTIGSVSPTSGSGLQTVNGELTHSSPKTISGGSTSFSFTWTAPSTPGTYYLRAIGNAVNGNNSNDGNDIWNWMQVQTVTVRGLELTSPNGGEQWCAGSSKSITWNQTGIDNVNIEFSSDGGSSFPTTLASGVNGAAGSWTWNIPSDFSAGQNFKIRISDASSASRNDISEASFSISTQASISSHPQSQNTCTGKQISFSVAASGGSLSYQWRKNGNNIGGARQSSYSISSVALTDAGTYDVQISGTCGTTITSNSATLSVDETPSITKQPLSLEECLGSNVTFTASASGTEKRFQWKKNGNDITGATDSSYSINNIKESDAGAYEVVVSGKCSPAATSNTATLVIATPPKITVQPVNKSACEGSNVELSVTAEGSSLTYQWRKDGANLSGGDQPIFTIASVKPSDAGKYEVIIRGKCNPSVTSKDVTVSIKPQTTISKHPIDKSVNEGGSALFSVIASGENLKYQWRKDGTNLTGKTTADLQLTSLKKSDAGSYDCVVTGDCGNKTSNAAVLTVIPVGPGPVLSLSVDSHDFGITSVGQSTEVSISGLLKNTGTENLSITQISLSGPDASEFNVVLPTLPITIKPGDSLSLTLQFDPNSGGAKEASIGFTSNSKTNPVISLSGFGGIFKLTSSENLLDFGSTVINMPIERTINITNDGNVKLNINTPIIVGTGKDVFLLISPGNPFSIEPAQSQEVTVAFTAETEGSASAELEINSLSLPEPLKISLKGVAVISSADDQLVFDGQINIYPNPVYSTMNINLGELNPQSIDVVIVDIYGNIITRFDDLTVNHLKWYGYDTHGRAVPAGIYSIVINNNGSMFTKTFTLIK